MITVDLVLSAISVFRKYHVLDNIMSTSFAPEIISSRSNNNQARKRVRTSYVMI